MVTLSITQYRELKKKAEKYDQIVKSVQNDLFAPPTVTDRKKIISSFRKTNFYNREFLSSLGRGLKRSKYFTN